MKRARVARCLRCQREFEPRRAGHVFCTRECRYRGPRRPDDGVVAPTDEQLASLFDPDRDPGERVTAEDWDATGGDWAELFAEDTVATRRRWLMRLVEWGRL
jgi:hypothetical protein